MRFAGLLFVASLTAWTDALFMACHAGVVESYVRKGMGRSTSRPRAESQAQRRLALFLGHQRKSLSPGFRRIRRFSRFAAKRQGSILRPPVEDYPI